MEAEDPAMVDDAVDDRGGHVPVAEHVAPPAGLEVRGGDDAAGLVAVRAGLEQKPGPVDVDGQVAELVDDGQPGPAYRLELGVQSVAVLGLPQPHDQARGGEEPHGYHALACEHADRDGQVGLAAADVAVEHEVLGPVDEFQAFQLFAAPVGGERGHAPVVSLQGLALGEPGLSGQPPPFGFGPARVLLLEQVGQEAELAGRGVPDGLPGHAVCQRQVAGEAHGPVPSWPCQERGRRAAAVFAGSFGLLHVSVVTLQILPAFGSRTLEDAFGTCADRRAVDGPSGVDDGLHRFDRGGEPAVGGNGSDVVEQIGARACVHAVEQGSHGFGEIVPDRAFAPYAGLSRDDREQTRRIHLGPRRFPPHAFQRDDMPAIGIAKLDLEDAHPGLQTHRTPSQAGRIPIRVDRGGAGLVGLHAPPVARVEPHAGQGQHAVLLRLEQFDHRSIMPVVIRSGDAFARVEPHASAFGSSRPTASAPSGCA